MDSGQGVYHLCVPLRKAGCFDLCAVSVYVDLHAVSVYVDLHAVSVYVDLHAVSVYVHECSTPQGDSGGGVSCSTNVC